MFASVGHFYTLTLMAYFHPLAPHQLRASQWPGRTCFLIWKLAGVGYFHADTMSDLHMCVYFL
ncbi:hypothetical protein EMIT0194MI4_50371 [Pseudomonas sp. IT-194MI4]